MRQLDAAVQAGVDLRELGVPEELVRRALELDKARNSSDAFRAVMSGGVRPEVFDEFVDSLVAQRRMTEKAARAAKASRNLDDLGEAASGLPRYSPWTDEDFVRQVMETTHDFDRQMVKRSSLSTFANDLASAERAAERIAVSYSGWDAAGFATSVTARAASHLVRSDALNVSREAFDQAEGARLAELQQAVQAGRMLTDDQRRELVGLQATAQAQSDLDRLAVGARLAGLSDSEIDSVVRRHMGSGTSWRDNAGEALQSQIDSQLSRSQPTAFGDQPARLPGDVVRSLGLPVTAGGNEVLNVADLAERLRRAGSHVVAQDGISVNSLAAQVTAGRHALVMLEGVGTAPLGWRRVKRTEVDRHGNQWIVVQDHDAGGELSYPVSVFEQASRQGSNTVIIDPFRDSDGRWHGGQAGPDADLDGPYVPDEILSRPPVYEP